MGVYQVQTFFTVAWYFYAFHVIWLAFFFDLHLKTGGYVERAREEHSGLAVFVEAFKNRVRHLYHWSYLRHYLNYLIMPSILYWSVVILMFLNPFHELFKDALIIISTASLSVAYWYLKQGFSRHMEMHNVGLRVLGLVKILAAYLAYTALLALGWYFGLNLFLLVPVVFLVTFLVLYQALFQHKLLKLEVYPLILLVSTLLALVFAVVFQKWNINYYTAGLLVTAVYNVVWGMLHKYLDRSLNRKLMWEYIFMLLVIVSLILATHDFKGRI
jgi:hypothetical protein